MLETIRLENWSELKTVVGTAEHVPDAVLGLLSENEAEVDASYWKLENYIVVQSDLSESAAYVPKYLEEVLLKAKFKGAVIELLFQIGTGISLDDDLQQKCYLEVLSVFERLLVNEILIGTRWEQIIREELGTLKELHDEKC